MALRWNHIFGESLFSNLSVSYSDFNYETFTISDVYFYDPIDDFTTEDFTASSFFSGITDFQVKYDFDFIPNNNHHAKAGLSYSKKFLSPGLLDFYSDVIDYQFDELTYDEVIEDGFENSYETQEYTVYGSDKFSLGDRTILNLGGAYTLFISDDIVYGAHAEYDLYQLNASLRQKLHKRVSAVLSFDKMFQPLHLVTTSNIGLPNDLWVPSTVGVSPMTSNQYNVSLNYLDKKLSINLQGYYKETDNILRYTNSFTGSLPTSLEIITNYWESEVVAGSSLSKGIELQTQLSYDHALFQFNYALAESNHTFENFTDVTSFPFEFDQRHKVFLHARKKVGKKLWLYTSWNYNSGMAQTLYESTTLFSPLSAFAYGDIEALSSFNGDRIKDYHRWDAGLVYGIKGKHVEFDITLGVQNILNRKNVFYSYYLNDEFDPSFSGLQESFALPRLPQIKIQATFN